MHIGVIFRYTWSSLLSWWPSWPSLSLTAAEVTAHLATAQLATAVLPRACKISVHGAESTAGIRLAANALFPTKAEEMPTPSTTTPTPQLMLDSGKSTLSTGAHALEVMLLATPTSTSNAPLKSINGEETPGSSGQLTLPADADCYLIILIFKSLVFIKWCAIIAITMH